MFTLTILLILAVMVALFGCLMGLFSIIGLFFSLLTGILVGALAGYLASRFMGTQTSFLRNVVLGVLGSFVGEFLFGMFHIYATGSFSSFVISVVGACVCIWIDNKLFHCAVCLEKAAAFGGESCGFFVSMESIVIFRQTML